jgi:hypothetical protein
MMNGGEFVCLVNNGDEYFKRCVRKEGIEIDNTTEPGESTYNELMELEQSNSTRSYM